MSSIDSKELVDALDDIVGKFGSEVASVAVDLTRHLAVAF